MRGAALLIVVVVALLGLWAQAAQAQEAPPPCGGKVASSSAAGDPCGDVTGSSADIGVEQGQANAVTDAVGKNKIAINFAWTLVTGFLVMFMQAGFALVETGFCRRKNAAHVMMTNFMIYAIGILGFWAVGYAFMFGGVGHIANLGGTNPLTSEFHAGGWGLFGTKGFGFNGIYDVGVMAHFLFNLVFMDTAATIVTGAMAERWKFSAFVVYGFWISMVIYPLFGNWAWGGGWLAQLGSKSGLGHGYVDFAGSGVVHAIGGFTGLAGAMVIGPRLGKYNRDGTSNTILPHSLPMAILGCFILAFGWFGFNPGSTLAATDLRISVVAVNTMLASASGALLIGAVAGALVIESVLFIDKRHVDDPVGAISVHGTCGLWGLIGLGLFADGTYGAGWHGVDGTVKGLFYGDPKQLVAELIGCATILVWAWGGGYLFFKAQDKLQGIRSKPEDELAGLDLPEMGIPAYTDVDETPAPAYGDGSRAPSPATT